MVSPTWPPALALWLVMVMVNTGVLAVPMKVISPRGALAHDAIVGFPQEKLATSSEAWSVYLKFQPWLKVVNGCVPFPAVDAKGNVGGGLEPTGAPEGHCSSSPGQVYVRSTTFNGNRAIMYSWYFPKDSPSTGIGHRHDWEAVVVWTDVSYSRVLGVAPSAHGDFTVDTQPPLDGTRAQVQYMSIWPLDHDLKITDARGGEQPLVAWEDLTDAARAALTDTDFGAANVPFKDANFMNNVILARLPGAIAA